METDDIALLNCIKAISDFPTTYRTSNLTPIAIMRQSGYAQLHLSVTVEVIAAYIIHHPKLIEDWQLYTENIRHGPAWGFGKNVDGSWTVSYSGKERIIEKYDDKFMACAKMIKMTVEDIRRLNPLYRI